MTSLLNSSDRMLCFPAQTFLLVTCIVSMCHGCEETLEFEVRCLTLGVSTPTVLLPIAMVPGGLRKHFFVVCPL